MRTLVVFCLLLISYSLLEAQSRRMANPQTGRTYTAENLANTPWPLLQQAEQQWRALNLQEALLTFESVVAQHPNSAEALILRAKFKYKIGMEAEADLDFQQAQRINPYVANLYGFSDNRGVLSLIAYEPENAIIKLSDFKKLNYYYEYLDRTMATDGHMAEEAPVLEKLIDQIEQEEFDGAQEMISQLQVKYPNSAIVHDLEGLALMQQNQLEAAETAFSKAIEVGPDFAISWYNMGALKHQKGYLNQAKYYLDKAVELDGTLTKAYFERARILRKLGDKESALADYDTIISQKGAIYPEALLNRGLTKKMIGSYADALADINKVIEAFPDAPELYKNRGNLYLLLDLLPKAIDDYTQAIQLDREYTDAYYNRALAHFLSLDHISGCADLDASSEGGHEIAQDMKRYFCQN